METPPLGGRHAPTPGGDPSARGTPSPCGEPVATPLHLPVSMRTATKGASPELRDAQEGSSDDPLGRSLHPAGTETLHSGNGTIARSGRGRQSGRPGVHPPFDATAAPVRGQGDTQRQPRRRCRNTRPCGPMGHLCGSVCASRAGYAARMPVDCPGKPRSGSPRSSLCGKTHLGAGQVVCWSDAPA